MTSAPDAGPVPTAAEPPESPTPALAGLPADVLPGTPQPAPRPRSDALPAESAEQPARAEPPARAGFAPALPATLLLVGAYFTAAGVFLLRWLVGLARLARLYSSARPAPSAVVAVFREVADDADRGVRLLVSDRVALPLMSGVFRPVILLPEGACADPEGLRYALAHEWSHVERGDIRALHLANLVQLLFFYVPLYWWLRRQLRLCQDYLADARAAAHAPEAEDYAAFLVGVARRRVAEPAPLALGIGDRRSNLYRRILMLIHRDRPLERSCRPTWSLAAALAALLALGASSSLRLDGAPAEDKGGKAKPAEKPGADDKKGETLNYSGKVTDKLTSKPVAGATVTVRRSVSNADFKVLQETRHKTDKDGKYRFTIPPEQAAERFLYIELDVEHPDYAPKTGFGYALSMIRKNEKMGGRPFFEHVTLRPGKAITGKLETPDGKPAAGVQVLSYSVSTTKFTPGEFDYGSFAKGKTDDKGRFRLVLVTPGDGVLWLLPKDFAPSSHVLKGKRGDLGTFVLDRGITLKGKVLDAKGKPLAGAYVNADRQRTPDSDEIFNRVADSVRRTATTNARGEFVFGPLPPGDYRVKPDENNYDGSEPGRKPRRPLPGVFLPQKVALKKGENPAPLTVQAVPHVYLEAQYLDSKGKPTTGHECFIFGQMDKEFWFGQGRPDAKGRIRAMIPHGLENTRVDLMTNEHGVLRWRKTKGGPLHNDRQVNLGTVNADVKGVEIIRYVAPILLVKLVARDGGPLKETAVTAEYPAGSKRNFGPFIVAKGRTTEVIFEKQEDGRFRSSQLLPDVEVTVTGHADGYKSAKAKAKLAEGTTKEIVITLEKGKDAEGKKEKKEKK